MGKSPFHEAALFAKPVPKIDIQDPGCITEVEPYRGTTPPGFIVGVEAGPVRTKLAVTDRKSTRLNSSHANISYAVFCLKNTPLSRIGSGYVGAQQIHSLQFPHQGLGLLQDLPMHHLALVRGPLPVP